MIYGYENHNVNLEQVSDICKNRKYGSLQIDEILVMEKFKRTEAGRIIPPTKDDDAEAKLLTITKSGDSVITSTLANFSATINGMVRTVRSLREKGVRVIAISEDFDSTTGVGEALMSVETLLDLYQKNCFKSRLASQKKGIAKAKEEGKEYGRKEYELLDFPLFDRYYREYRARFLTKAAFAEKIGVSRPTLDKLIQMYTYQKSHLQEVENE